MNTPSSGVASHFQPQETYSNDGTQYSFAGTEYAFSLHCLRTPSQIIFFSYSMGHQEEPISFEELRTPIQQQMPTFMEHQEFTDPTAQGLASLINGLDVDFNYSDNIQFSK